MSILTDFEGSPTIQHVLEFARDMELKLAANRHKGDRAGWLQMDPWDLLRRLRDEVTELEIEMERCHSADEVAREAADVGNFAMMVADSYRHRKTIDGNYPQSDV